MKLLAAAAALAALAPAVAQAADAQTLCTQTVNAYAGDWDRRDAAHFATLFADDATLDLGQPTKGKAAISELFSRRASASTTRHMMSNIQITPVNATTARGVSYLLLFAGPGAGTPPMEAAGYTLMAEYHDQFRVTPTSCVITERKLVPIFRQPRPAITPAAAAAPAAPAPAPR